MAGKTTDNRQTLVRETATLVIGLVIGLIALPPVIYWVGQVIFGAYAGGGLGDFYSNLQAQLRAGNVFACFLVFSPYLIWQALRGTIRLFRFVGRQP